MTKNNIEEICNLKTAKVLESYLTDNINPRIQKENKEIFKERKAISRSIRKIYKQFKDTALQRGTNSKYFLIPDKRFGSNPIRPYFALKMSGLIKEIYKKNFQLERELELQIGFIFEMIICIQYYDNQILDRKYDVKDIESIELNLRSANTLKLLLYEHIIGLETSGKNIKQIVNYVNKVFLYVDVGQFLQINFNTLEAYNLSKSNLKCNIGESIDIFISSTLNEYKLKNITFADLAAKVAKDPLVLIKYNIYNCLLKKEHSIHHEENISDPNYSIGKKISDFCDHSLINHIISFISKTKKSKNKEAFVSNYLSRITLTCGTLYISITEVLLACGGIKNECLVQFTKVFGIMRQVVNDITDCFSFYDEYNKKDKKVKNPTCTKKKRDSYSDLRNDNITLPYILFFRVKPEMNIKLKTFIGLDSFTKAQELQILDDLKKSHSLYLSMNISRFLSKVALNQLGKTLKENGLKRSNNILGIEYMCSISEVNKYTKVFFMDKYSHKIYHYSNEYGDFELKKEKIIESFKNVKESISAKKLEKFT